MAQTRREFIKNTGIAVSNAVFPWFINSCSSVQQINHKQGSILSGVPIYDAHCHPDSFYRRALRKPVYDYSFTLNHMLELGMEAGVFCAVGDYRARGKINPSISDYDSVQTQLDYLQELLESKKIPLILKSSDLPPAFELQSSPGAILGIEGGDALENKVQNLNHFYQRGVRLVTIVHHFSNGLADSMTRAPRHLSISSDGKRMVERMQELGMMIDVAHMSRYSLKSLVEMTEVPLLDSHSNVVEFFSPGRRQRSFEEVELIVKTGGVVCTWPLGYSTRKSMDDWADEIVQFKSRFGIDHIGLGTDGGGGLPKLLKGYKNIKSLPTLAEKMLQKGLSLNDISKFMGGNFERVFKACNA